LSRCEHEGLTVGREGWFGHGPAEPEHVHREAAARVEQAHPKGSKREFVQAEGDEEL